MTRLATEYLALMLPGTPAKVATLLGCSPDDVRVARTGATPARIAALRRQLNQITLDPDNSRPATVHYHYAGKTTSCCQERLERLPDDDRITDTLSRMTCKG